MGHPSYLSLRETAAYLGCDLPWYQVYRDYYWRCVSSGKWLLELIHVTDKFSKQILQRLADSWRSSIGSTALSVLIAYFESRDDLQDSDESRAEFANYALDKLRFCYKKADGDDEEVSVYYMYGVQSY